MPAETGLDPVIHAPARLRVMVTLATLRDGDNLSWRRQRPDLGQPQSPGPQGPLDTYTAALRKLLDSATTNGTGPH